MMTNKIVIANSKFANYGKSTSVRYVFEILSSHYPYHVIKPATGIYDSSQDVEAIIEMPQTDGHIVKVGIESMGDPEPTKRLKSSIDHFVAIGCEIILVSCRTKGDTVSYVNDLRRLHQYQIIWFDNSTMKVDSWNRSLTNQDAILQDQLSRDYGFYVVSLIERLVLTGGVI